MSTVDRTEEAALVGRYKAGDRRAGEGLLRMHAGIIYKSARSYFGHGIDEDLVQEASIGFLRAVQRFDLSRGTALTTYAGRRARSAAYNYLCANDGAIAISQDVRVALRRARKAGMSAADIAGAGWRGAARAAEAATYSYRPLSLDAPISDDSETTLGETLGSSALSPEEILTRGDEVHRRRERVERLFAQLKPRQAEVLRKRFLGPEERTQESIAEELGIQRQAVQQCEARAVGHLREAVRREALCL